MLGFGFHPQLTLIAPLVRLWSFMDSKPLSADERHIELEWSAPAASSMAAEPMYILPTTVRIAFVRAATRKGKQKMTPDSHRVGTPRLSDRCAALSTWKRCRILTRNNCCCSRAEQREQHQSHRLSGALLQNSPRKSTVIRSASRFVRFVPRFTNRERFVRRIASHWQSYQPLSGGVFEGFQGAQRHLSEVMALLTVHDSV